MTCIAGVVKGSKVWIGGDSAGVGGWDLQVRADEKVFKKGEFIYGFTSSFRARDIARYAFKPPAQPKRQSDHEYLATTFIDEYRKACIAAGMEHLNNVVDGGSFLLGYRGELYEIDTDFQIGRNVARFNAIGCGGSIALGALDATPTKPPALRVRHALEAAERWSAGVRGPFKVLSL
jgi:hypothetical protein